MIKIYLNIVSKIFKDRRSDVSLYILSKVILVFLIGKVISKLKRFKTKKNSCLIIFPPSLGLGDLIILSRIVDIIKESNYFNAVGVANLAPFLQIKNKDVSFSTLLNLNYIYSFENFIFPSPSLVNIFLSHIIGQNKCKGYIKNKKVNFKDQTEYKIKFDDPYFFRLKPFKYFFKYRKTIKPYVWNSRNRVNLELSNSFHSIERYKKNKLSNKEEIFVVLSTYNFYKKFRPCFSKIINEINNIRKDSKNFNLILLGANASKEIAYNSELEEKIKKSTKNIQISNLTGKLSINSSLEIISQSNYYLGANNGLANVAQMLGIKCKLIFNGPEKSKKRKFSEYAKFNS